MIDANTLGMPAPAVSVVVPVRNEAGNVAPLVAETYAAPASAIEKAKAVLGNQL